jgi:hypothetical protein
MIRSQDECHGEDGTKYTRAELRALLALHAPALTPGSPPEAPWCSVGLGEKERKKVGKTWGTLEEKPGENLGGLESLTW